MLLKLSILVCIFRLTVCKDLPKTCDSPIYCYGDLLRTVQLGQVFNDSSAFVTMKMIYNQNETLKNFQQLQTETDSNPTRAQIIKFVNENFQKVDELDTPELPDFNPQPRFLNQIGNETIRNFASKLIQIWPRLAKKIKPEVVRNIEQHSILPLPGTFLVLSVPYTEYYYWGAKYMVEGLLLCGMKETAKTMVDGLLYLVNRYGFIPNGGRIYHLERSETPVLTDTVNLYYKATNDTIWLSKSIDTLVKEIEYWNKQTVKVKKGSKTYTFYRYSSPSLGPKSEQYRYDVEIASNFKNECEKQRVYSNLKSAAESGWPFSSRWNYDVFGGNKANTSYVKTMRTIPVDLNSIMCSAFSTLSKFFAILGNDSESEKWKLKYFEMIEGMNKVLWNDEYKIWFDYDIKLCKHRKYYYLSNVTPLGSNCFDTNRTEEMAKNVLNYLKRSKVLDYPGGVPTSLYNTGLEYDFPNAIPPLQYAVVEGLKNTNYQPARDQAEVIAKKLINSCILGLNKTGIIFPQYSVLKPGEFGTGTWNMSNIGFGWTNGIALKFIYDYYRK